MVCIECSGLLPPIPVSFFLGPSVGSSVAKKKPPLLTDFVERFTLGDFFANLDAMAFLAATFSTFLRYDVNNTISPLLLTYSLVPLGFMYITFFLSFIKTVLTFL